MVFSFGSLSTLRSAMGAGESMDIFKEGELENSAIFKDQSSMDYVSTGYDRIKVSWRSGWV